MKKYKIIRFNFFFLFVPSAVSANVQKKRQKLVLAVVKLNFFNKFNLFQNLAFSGFYSVWVDYNVFDCAEYNCIDDEIFWDVTRIWTMSTCHKCRIHDAFQARFRLSAENQKSIRREIVLGWNLTNRNRSSGPSFEFILNVDQDYI